MKVIDLTKPIYTGMEVYPGDPEVSVATVHTYEKNSWLLRRITMGSHTGTHVDAFSHMDEHGETLDKIPLNRFFGRARLVDPGRPFPTGLGLFFRENIDIDSLDKILAAGPPFAAGEISEALERLLLKNRVVTYTNLINLEQLPVDQDFMFFGFPLHIKEGDGSPVRAVAVIGLTGSW